MQEEENPKILRKQQFMYSLTQRFKVGRSQQEKDIFVERMRSMECHDMFFAEPMPRFDEENETSW